MVRRQRLRLGWALADLSERCGISTATLSVIENNSSKHPPTMATLAKLEGALHFEPGKLQVFRLLDETPRLVVDALRDLLHGRQPQCEGYAAMTAMIERLSNEP